VGEIADRAQEAREGRLQGERNGVFLVSGERERERNKDPIFSLFLGVFQIDLRHYDGNIWNARILFFFGGIFPGQICGVVAQSLLFLELRYFRFDSRHRASKMNPLCPEWQRLCPSEQYAHRSVSFILRTFIS
jgi:hypothetical protein